MKVLTLRRPWAYAVVCGAKDVENRSRKTHYRGELLIHAGIGFEQHALHKLVALGVEIPSPIDPDTVDHPYFASGAIVGSVQVVNCIQDSWSPWAAPGRWHWLLRDPVVFNMPIPCRGMLGLWNVPAELEAAVEAARTAAAFLDATREPVQLGGLSVKLA